jgi:ATP-dependent exoDNAse (exonuclease V) alpha subunit
LADAYGRDGWAVKGSATSGAAARQLQTEAGVESTTVAALLWRLEADRVNPRRAGRPRLDAHTLLIVDESGMVSDADLVAVLEAADRHGTKVVLVGDHLQLASIGPGGNLEHLVERFPDAVWTLDENRRQGPEEAAVLAQLRHGMAEHGRIRMADTHDEVLDLMAGNFAEDVVAGKDTMLLASTRASVAELNLRARAELIDRDVVDQAHDVETPNGTRYAPGDWVVMTAPLHEQTLVNSQRGRVVATDVDRHGTVTVTARMDGDREPHRLAGEDLDRLALGYCQTVHKVEGQTFADDVHRLEEPGAGREAAYVAVSRSKSATYTYGTWPDLDAAREELGDNWGRERRQFFVGERVLDDDRQAAVRRIESARAVERSRSADRERDRDQDLEISL